MVQQKNAKDCNNPGPVTAGFNQAACGAFCVDVYKFHVLQNVHHFLTSFFSAFLTQIYSMDSGVPTLETAQC